MNTNSISSPKFLRVAADGMGDRTPVVSDALRAAADRIEELERLTHYFPRNNGHPNAGSEVDRLREIIADVDKRWMSALKERNALRAENEALKKAGNNLAAEFCQWCPHEVRGPFLRAWDAARKEGAK